MKNILLIAISLMMVSCFTPKEAAVSHQYHDGKVTIQVTAVKDEMVGPWKVTMKFKVYNFDESKMDVLVYTDEISDKTVTFDWRDETTCIINFQQSDGKPRAFKLTAAPNNLEVISLHN